MFGDPAGRLYPIIDATLCARRGLDPLAVASACLRGGARVIQLRLKGGSSDGFLRLADAFVAIAAASAAMVVVNDRADVALMAGAGGVHVGQDDLPPDAVRRLGAGMAIGVSTHDERQADDALASSADYVAVGPVFETATKDTGYRARGLGLVRHAAHRGKPVVAIGGITIDRAPAAIAAGAASVAVISDIIAAGDPEARVREYLQALA